MHFRQQTFIRLLISALSSHSDHNDAEITLTVVSTLLLRGGRKWNGTASFISPDWYELRVLHAYTDASTSLGFGGFYADHWFCVGWPGWPSGRPRFIELIEMVATLVALLLWSP